MSEWEGINPSKFKKTKKLIKAAVVREENTAGLYGDIDIGIERIKGRKHFGQEENKNEFRWRPSFKKTEIDVVEAKTRGIRKVSLNHQESKARAERKHVTPIRKPIVNETFNDYIPPMPPVSYVLNNRIW